MWCWSINGRCRINGQSGQTLIYGKRCLLPIPKQPEDARFQQEFIPIPAIIWSFSGNSVSSRQVIGL